MRSSIRTGAMIGVAATSLCFGISAFAADPSADVGSRLSVAPGVSGLKVKKSKDGGEQVNGQLEGRTFALRVPQNWNGKAVLFAHGYAMPDGKKGDTVSSDPVAEDPSFGLFPHAYGQGYAVGHTSYDKLGLATASGIQRNVALARLLRRVGTAKVYLTGASMGGSITALTTQRYPTDFDGAMAVCGPVSDWTRQIDYVVGVRALYNYFSAGSPYELPGTKDVTSNPRNGNIIKLFLRLRKLQNDATAEPDGPAARLIANTMTAVPGQETKSEFSSLVLALILASNGMDDFNEVMGGMPADNSAVTYHSALLDERQNAELNRTIQRYRADPAARAKLARDFSTSGDQRTKLLTIHNAYDSLVAYEQEERFRARVGQAGNAGALALRTVPTMTLAFSSPMIKKAFPFSGLFKGSFGAMHCGFTPEQMESNFADMVAWANGGPKPNETFRSDLDR